MEFRTRLITETQSHHTISYGSEIMLLGSCFAENIGEKLDYYQFKQTVNPFGILYHPLAIEHFITRVINSEYYSEEDIFEQDGVWRCLDAHSRLSSVNRGELSDRLNSALHQSLKCLSAASHLIITFGTAWVYRKIDEDRIVANCHKIPQKKFQKELLSVDDISESVQSIIALCKALNPKMNLIFTVSPVRHLRDGLVDNAISKAQLLAGLHLNMDKRERLFYFPSYEIMMDDLRDYRFYKADLIHPNETAIEYIWESFKNSWIDEDCFEVMEEVGSIRKADAHKPFQPDSDAHKAFITKLEERKAKLLEKFPHMEFI